MLSVVVFSHERRIKIKSERHALQMKLNKLAGLGRHQIHKNPNTHANKTIQGTLSLMFMIHCSDDKGNNKRSYQLQNFVGGQHL